MDVINNNNTDSNIAVNDGVKHVEKFADPERIKSKRRAGQKQRRKIQRQDFILGNAGEQRNTEEMNGKVQIDIEEMFFDVQTIRKLFRTQHDQGIGNGIKPIIFRKRKQLMRRQGKTEPGGQRGKRQRQNEAVVKPVRQKKEESHR